MIRGPAAAAACLSLLTAPATARAQVAPSAPETLAVGEWQLAPVVDLRIRGEYRHDLDDHDRGALVERARLGVDAQHGPVEVRVVLQDARAVDLASGTDMIPGPPAQTMTGAYEAWAQAQTASFRPSFLRVGRQAIQWGEGRLLGSDDGAPAGRSLDAIRGRLVVGDGAVEVLAAILEDAGSLTPNAYGELLGARGEWTFAPLFAVEVYALARLAQANPAGGTVTGVGLGSGGSDPALEGSVEGETYTGALRLSGDAAPWTWAAEGAYQLGRVSVMAEDRGAWAAAAHLGYAFEHALWQPTARLGVAYASGDEGGHTYRAFDPLLPDVHTWHGAMDVFAWSNEEEANVRLGVAPFADAVAAIEYRYARLAEASGTWRSGYLMTLGSAPTNTHADLGHEIDASISWSPWAPVNLGAGYSVFFLGDGARAILGTQEPAHVSHFAFGEARLRF